MSFGWSAGDLATAVAVLYNLIQALDSCDGAASDYREAVRFLGDLKQTLEPLQTFAAWEAYPSYRKDIEEQVILIKEPIQSFLEAVVKFEPSLGQNATSGHHRHVFRKLQWHFTMSSKVQALKGKVEPHMRIVDTLLQRLTLDVVLTVKTQLPQELRAIFENTLHPELIDLLRQNLHPLKDNLFINFRNIQDAHYEKLSSRLSEHYTGLAADIQWLKEHINKPCLVQDEIKCSIPGSYPIRNPTFDSVRQTSVDLNLPDDCENLRDLYYMVFVYIGVFLKTLLQELCRLVQPSRALMPTLLAKYNISFFDALGRAPRILPYEMFQTYEVIEAFIRQEFRNLPGAWWATKREYVLVSSGGPDSNLPLTSPYWNNFIAPGTTITMAMIVHKVFQPTSAKRDSQCPRFGCSGSWVWYPTLRWTICPSCKREVYNTLDFVENFEGEIDMGEQIDQEDASADSQFDGRPQSDAQDGAEEEKVSSRDKMSGSPSAATMRKPKDDVAFFKRIAETVHISSTVTLTLHGAAP